MDIQKKHMKPMADAVVSMKIAAVGTTVAASFSLLNKIDLIGYEDLP